MRKYWKTIMFCGLAVCFWLISIPQLAWAQTEQALTNLIQIVYNDQNGLPSSEANTVVQTKDGYIWIGSYGGLIRYNGREFYNYSTAPNGLPTSGIRALFEDDAGRLWIGTNDKGVFLYDQGRFLPCGMPDGHSFNSIRCFAQDADGVIYVGTSTGLARLDGQTLAAVSIPELSGQTIYSLSIDENNVLWGTAGAGFAFAAQGERLLYWLKPGDLSPNENYTALAHGQTIYIGTSGNELLVLTLTDEQYTSESYQAAAYSTDSLQTANTLCMTRQGELWLGCNTGSGWFDEQMNLHILQDMAQNTFLSCITQDYEDNLWLASTQGGVFQLAQGTFLNANKTAGWKGKSINAVIKACGLLYAASDYGLYIVNDQWQPIHNALTQYLEGVRIRHLFLDSRGYIWIGTYSDLGLLCYKPSSGSLTSFTEADGLLNNKVRLVLELADGDIAVATAAGICLIRDQKIVECYSQERGLENPVILCLLQTSDGTLLAGSDGMGIYAIKDHQVYTINEAQGLDTGVILRMRSDPEAGGIWVSAGSSLYFLSAEGTVREISDFHYGIGSVFDIQVVGDDIWLTKSSGLIIVPRAALLGEQEMTSRQYDRDSGLIDSLTANSWNLLDDGKLYLCSVNGVYVWDYDRPAQHGHTPKIAVDEITVQAEDGRTVVYANPTSLTLPSNTQRITLRFSYLSFAGEAGSITYQLESFDDLPVTVPAKQVEAVSYTNLHGGEYTFQLSAGALEGPADGNILSVAIHKERRPLERPIVWLLLVILAALLVVLSNKFFLEVKTRKLKRRQMEYKEITDQALKTIANTIDAKDPYTRGHSVRVACYSQELARRMGLSEDQQEKIYYTALLHDIGKIGIPDAILNKPGMLTPEEFETMKTHTTIGSDILKDFTALPQIGDGALSHHENYDGSGYPEHRASDDIPLVAQIIRAADSYDAMATKRSYRDGMSTEYILSEFQKYSGIQFEPHIAHLITDMVQEGFICQENL